MSSSEPYSSSDGSEEDLQAAQQIDEHAAADTSSQEDNELLNEIEDRGSASPGDPSSEPNLHIEGELHAHAIKYDATLQYDENAQLQPIYPHPHGNLFNDNPSGALWRHRTMAERDLIVSLDQCRSSNLSIHLYNTFVLKRRAKSQLPNEMGSVETKEPSKAWTAWPLMPDVVPREHQQKKWDDDDWRVGPYVRRESRPGDELRELLMARVVKTAKERFVARETESSLEEGEGREEMRPVVMADDEIAANLLRPSIEHVLARLDCLLKGLHRSRSSYLSLEQSKGKIVPRKSKPVSTEGTKESGKRSVSLTDCEGGLNDVADADGETSDPEKSRGPKKQKGEPATAHGNVRIIRSSRTGRLSLRNWDDVLGLASLIGIDSPVVGRAASRCAELLGEDMAFGTDYQGLGDDNETLHLPYGSTSDKLEPPGDEGHEDTDMHGGIHVDGFLQPIQGKPSWKLPSKPQRNPVVETPGCSDPEN